MYKITKNHPVYSAFQIDGVIIFLLYYAFSFFFAANMTSTPQMIRTAASATSI